MFSTVFTSNFSGRDFITSERLASDNSKASTALFISPFLALSFANWTIASRFLTALSIVIASSIFEELNYLTHF